MMDEDTRTVRLLLDALSAAPACKPESVYLLHDRNQRRRRRRLGALGSLVVVAVAASAAVLPGQQEDRTLSTDIASSGGMVVATPTTETSLGTATRVSQMGVLGTVQEALINGGTLAWAEIDSIENDEGLSITLEIKTAFHGPNAPESVTWEHPGSGTYDRELIKEWNVQAGTEVLAALRSDGTVVSLAIPRLDQPDHYYNPASGGSIFALGGAAEELASGLGFVRVECQNVRLWGSEPHSALLNYFNGVEERDATEEARSLTDLAYDISDSIVVAYDDATKTDLHPDPILIREQLESGVHEAEVELTPSVPIMLTMSAIDQVSGPGSIDVVAFTDSTDDRFLGWARIRARSSSVVAIGRPMGDAIHLWFVDTYELTGCSGSDLGPAIAEFGQPVTSVDSSLALAESRVHIFIDQGRVEPVVAQSD